MGLAIDIIKLIIILSILMVTLTYSIMGASEVTKVDNYNSDENLQSFHKYLTMSSVVTSVVLAVVVVGIVIFLIFGGAESLNKSLDPMIKMVIDVSLILEILCVIFNSVAMWYSFKAKSSNDHFKEARKDAWVSISFVIIFITFVSVIKIFEKVKEKRTDEELTKTRAELVAKGIHPKDVEKEMETE